MPVLHRTRHRHEPLDTTRKADGPEVYEKGRVCQSCGSSISIYNPSKTTCQPCQKALRDKALAKHRLDDGFVSYRRLMEEP